MGALGNKVFDDDTACDVREEYVGLLTQGLTGPAATERMLESWKDSIDDTDDGPVFWLALAVTQHKYGRLEPRVKAHALEVLDQKLGLDRWREAGDRALAGRLKQLEKVRDGLMVPQPAEKHVAPPFRDSCAWQAGEVVGYRLKSDRLALFGVLGTEEHANGVSPVCELLDWKGNAPPGAEDVAAAGARRGTIPPESLLMALAATDPVHATNPMRARLRLLADIGLAELPHDDGDFGLRQVGAVTQVIYRLKTGDREVTARLIQYARQRKPELLEPVTQFSVRREFKKSELPTKRVVRLKTRRSSVPPPGEWMVFRWYELDEALKDVFGVK